MYHSTRPSLSLAASLAAPLTRTTRPYSTKYTPPAPAPLSLNPEEQKEWTALQRSAEAKSQQVLFHPDVRRKPAPEFEGERNPTTGEVGGPKNDPLRHGDYSYGGRCTDF